jgi:glutathione S-transferase
MLVVITLLAFLLKPGTSFAPLHQQGWGSTIHKTGVTSSVLRESFIDKIITTVTSPKVTVPKDFVLPEPKPLSITEGTDLAKLASSSAALAVRLGTGATVLGWKVDDINYQGDGYSLKLGPLSLRDSSSILQNAPRPQKTLILYGYDASPYCKIVRETLNLLDLTYEYRPCPGARQGKFSQDMLQTTGRQTVPYLIDPNTNKKMFDSQNIIKYLVSNYGPPSEQFDDKALWPITTSTFAVNTATIAASLMNMPGAQRQINARPDNEQMQSLEVWAYECSPFCRPVFEKLCSLCLPHRIVSCSRGSVNRDILFAKTGRFQVPYLVDPNTGIEMFESTAIVDYLEKVYTV